MKQKIDLLIQKITEDHDSNDILEAKRDYQKIAGEIYEDDKSYEARMGLFLEWYVFNRHSFGEGKTPLDLLIENNVAGGLPDELKNIKEFSNNINGLFLVKKIRDNEVVVLNLFDDTKYNVKENAGNFIFHKTDLFEGRIVLFEGNYYFTGNFCFHPKDAEKFIKSEVKKINVVRDGFLNELKKINSDLKSLSSRLDKNAKEIEKLNGKIEKLNSTDKIGPLNEKLDGFKNTRSELIQQVSRMEVDKSNVENQKLKQEIGELISQLIQRLGYMNLKWERSRQIDLHDIYCD